MLEGAGFEVATRASAAALMEWPDDETAWRALRSPGIALPSLEAVGEDGLALPVRDSWLVFSARRPSGG